MERRQALRAGLVVMVVLLAFFGLRSLVAYRALMERAVYGEATVASLRGWMSVPYAASLTEADTACVCMALEVPVSACDATKVRDVLAARRITDRRVFVTYLDEAFDSCRAAPAPPPMLEEGKSISDALLSRLVTNTYPVLAVGVVIASAGIPAPSSLLVIAAGAFAARGFANLFVVMVIAALGSSLGDTILYLIGVKVGSSGDRLPGFLAKTLETERDSFSGCRPSLVFTSRFIFTPLIIPVNLLAGMYGCAYRKFIPYVLGGEAVWAVEMAGLGYVFGANIELVNDVVGNLTAVAVLLLGVWVVVRRLQHRGNGDVPCTTCTDN